MDEIKAKQQVVSKIKESSKILVTVSDNPSVDALSAAIGLTMVFDKQEKYATAIFSGETPPAIAFLEPEKTFDDTTDSLRDFIIALDKEKADHLRYKVDGDAVKIFITPYKTTIDETDLEFSQGDYNVELVIALGVDNQEHLDKALENHGQILHDAAIITMTTGDQLSDLGGIDWHDSSSSSLSEMVAGLAEALKDDKKKPIIDAPIATALLTGIVAETDRFSNQHTSSRALTVAASLMSAGADQQLIANELQAAESVTDTATNTAAEDADSDVETPAESETPQQSTPKDKSTLAIKHTDEPKDEEGEGETLADLDRRVRGATKSSQKVAAEVAAVRAEEEIEANKEESAESEVASEPEVPTPAYSTAEPTVGEAKANAYGIATETTDEPTLGGTLNATAEQAAEDNRREEKESHNHTILEHSYLGANTSATPDSPTSTSDFPGTPAVAPGSVGVNDFSELEQPNSDGTVHSSYAFDTPAESTPPVDTGISGEKVIQPLVDAAHATAEPAANPFAAIAPSGAPAAPSDLGLPLPPPIPDFSQGGVPALPVPPTPQPAILGDILAPEPADTTNAVPAPNTAYAPEPVPSTPQPVAPTEQSKDPSQFQIPPQ